MPKISLEKKTKIDADIYKIENVVYELPEKIVYNGKLLWYDSYHRAYMDGETCIKAIDYLEERLNESKEYAEDYKSMD